MHSNILIKSLAIAAICTAASSSQAALTLYTTQSSFLAASTTTYVDAFTDISLYDATTGPLTRAAGIYTYKVSDTSGSFFGAGTDANPSLSTNLNTDSITFYSFASSVGAIGADFFGSDVTGAYLLGDITLTATDSTGATFTQTLSGATASSFYGFTSTGSITSLSVTAVQAATNLWPTVDNLTVGVAAAAAVPEPQNLALMLAGLGAVGAFARRRNRAARQ